MSLLQKEQSLQVSADKVGMDRQTARKYRKIQKLPSELRPNHDWRTRIDPFEEVWPWVADQLAMNSGLEAKTLLEALQRAHPGKFADGQLRTLQRQVKRWRGLEGPGREVFFAQKHHPGRLCQSDYRYQADLFPSSLFRMAYDRLKSQSADSAAKQYLKILELAAKESESLVEAAIGHLAQTGQAMSFETVEAVVQSRQKLAAPTAVQVADVDLSAYDQLLEAEAGLGVSHE